MDLLGGYGSGSDSEPGSPQGNAGTATLLKSGSPPRANPARAPAVATQDVDPSQLLSKLPAPSQGPKVRRLGAGGGAGCRPPVLRCALRLAPESLLCTVHS